MGFSSWLFGKGHHRKNDGHHKNSSGYLKRGSYGEVGYACPTCRTPNSATSRFCGQCGVSLVCRGCDANLVAGAKFCAQCGRENL
ncbi:MULTISPECIES: double zinc ribbon domain-containing protein [Delftia]|uniref:Zinc ribbon domain-containing protein n=1 Tax=Delftia deserti TaxID=1651218 RepID=A0ABW5ENX7_9BURK|nr:MULTISPECIES: zinc ribbon domain-containing protein [Delftia]MDH0421451.1 zinc ribbon domain-containing protein [Delftia tsuruhatensis]MDH2234280.1 zinc ribbon domain-containing protein [Delftia tsuruhatensis]QFS63554.1 hypothetical protein GCS91_04140 [Delftia tsuruhatensis]WAT86373.1 zinc ribbon domain-containing protein [Delftia acidovorans]WON90880.1 zinc ribbon domain-containing protein [Delftia sp. UGAL515B_04]